MRARVCTGCVLLVLSSALTAHDGPPFPILSDHVSGPYRISIWTDPDTTDDGSPGGQFWIRLYRAGGGEPVPEGTRATVTITPQDRVGLPHAADGEPVRGDVSNQFAAVVMDHEGRFTVEVAIEGPLGRASARSAVDATYDLRPAPGLLLLYLTPFVLVGLLWGRVLIRRRGTSSGDKV